ncbi:MAG: insulinase family protein [Elusimicrobia bacterium]|nr:insulinase family protein [Elusimicrobiota bacterium]
MNKKIWASLVFALAGFPLWAASFDVSRLPKTYETPLADDPMGVTVHRLENGLTVYLSPNHQTPRVEAWIAVRGGSKLDPQDLTGMAHYLEHMLFKGTTRLGTLDFDKEKVHLDRIEALYNELFKTTDPKKRNNIYKEIDAENIEAGKFAAPNEIDKLYTTWGFNGVNAFTSKEAIVYVCDFPKNRLEQWSQVEEDRFKNPIFRLFQSEIEAVYEEKNRSMDNAERILRDALISELYKGHPLGLTTLGSMDHLKNPNVSRMKEYFDRYYVPNNMAVILAGDFEPAEALGIIRQRFGSWQPKNFSLPKLPQLPKFSDVKRLTVNYEAEEKVVIAWPAISHNDPDWPALRMLDMVMDNSETGIINLDINQQQKVKAAGSGPDTYNEGGSWQMWAIPKKDQTLEQAEDLLMQSLAKLKSGAFTQEDLTAILTNYEISEKARLESNGARVQMMADSFIEEKSWEESAQWVNRLRAVRKDDILRVAGQYLGQGRVVIYRRKDKPEIPSMTKPGFTKIDIDPTKQSSFFGELAAQKAAAIAPRWVKEGEDFRIEKFPWGKLYAVKNPMNDLFSIEFQFERGWRQERELCQAFNLLEFAGADEMDPQTFKRKLYSLGTSMGFYCGEYYSGVSLSGIEMNFDESLALMKLRLEKPRIEPDTLKKMVEVTLGRRKDEKLDPRSVHSALGSLAMLGPKSPQINRLSNQELEALTTDDLKSRLGRVFDYERKISYVGIREPKALAAALADSKTAFVKTAKRPPYEYLRTPKPKVYFVHRDMVQSQAGFFAADERVNPKKWIDYITYSEYMGGGMSGVIFQEVRESRSLAYAASGSYSKGSIQGDENMLYGYVGCQADKTIEAANLMVELFQNMPASVERFNQAKQAILESYRTDPLTFRSINGAVMSWEELGLGTKDPRPSRMKKAMKFKLSDLEKFAARFQKRPITVYILGNKNRVDWEGLKKIGDFEEKQIPELFRD